MTRQPWTRARLEEVRAAGATTDGRLDHLVAVLEALGRLHERGQAPASSRLVAALANPPLPMRACPILGLGRGLGLVELVPEVPGQPSGWKLTEEGLALVREPRPGGPRHA